jgi:3,4-dihydroxy 2-butanone 4-phosphate synthase/GTP cyclohydrolase II
LDQVEHLALLFGDLRTANPPLVRIHRENKTSDVFTRHAAGSNAPLTQAMARIQKEGRGIIIYLSANETMTKPSSSNLADETVELTRNRTWREIGIGAQILRELGVRHIRLLTTQTHDYVGLGGFDLHIDSVELLSRGPT